MFQHRRPRCHQLTAQRHFQQIPQHQGFVLHGSTIMGIAAMTVDKDRWLLVISQLVSTAQLEQSVATTTELLHQLVCLL